jgi:Phage integrase family
VTLQTRRFDQFIQHGLYLRNWSPTTVRTYRQGLRRLGIEVPTKTDLDAWVIRMRQDGLTPGGCNMYIRTINAYLTWLHEEGTIDQRLRVKVLRAPLKQIRLLADAEIRLLLNYRPRRRTDRRTWTLTLLLLDTGLRIAEALSLERSRIDLDQMTLIVVGKGNKERMVPFSVELRKVLYRWLKAPHGRSTRYAFSSFAGRRTCSVPWSRSMSVHCSPSPSPSRSPQANATVKNASSESPSIAFKNALDSSGVNGRISRATTRGASIKVATFRVTSRQRIQWQDDQSAYTLIPVLEWLETRHQPRRDWHWTPERSAKYQVKGRRAG